METMKLTEKKKSSKGVVIGLLLFFIIALFFQKAREILKEVLEYRKNR